jgi:hypothetical protein
MMAAADFLTWEGSVALSEDPRRPSTDDLGGDEKLDDTEFPPDDVEHPTAAGWNQLVKQQAATAKVNAACKLEVRFSAGTPALVRFTTPRGDLTIATFTVQDNGNGDVTVTWPANTFPPHACSPTGLTLLTSATTFVAGHLDEVTNGVRVRTFNSSGTATDIDWTLTIN